ncbi:MAG: aldo/keto reductase [Anaerolineae bacterium]
MENTRSDNGAGRRIAWGILGTGRIATTLAKALAKSETGRLMAVGSRSLESAERFAAEQGAPRAYGSYEGLLADPEVEAVYIALPNHLHALWTIRCAEAGKHILCEKPLATNYGEAMSAVEAARRHDVFLMEAFMYRCHPQTAKLVELVRSKAIGDVRVIHVNFSFNMGDARPDDIRRQGAYAGGGITDVGCYCASMARLVAGAALGKPFVDPLDVKGSGHVNPSGEVDEWASALLRFPGDILATLTCGTQVGIDSTLRIWGSQGHIAVPNPWFPGEQGARIELHRAGQKEPEIITVDAGAHLYSIEADTVARHIAHRQAPPPCMTWNDSLGNMRTLDRWRRDFGLVFGNEKPEALTHTFAGRPLARRENHPMQYGRVQGLDKPVSRVVMGSMIYRDDDLPFASAMLDHFYTLGGNCLDTAYVYRTEGMLGRWINLRGIREQVVVLAKGAHTPYCDPENLTKQLYETLDRLQSDYVDIYLMHRDNPDVPVGEFVECMDEHRRAGRIRAYGGSNWSTPRIDEANAYARAHGLAGFSASSPNLALAVWNEPMWAGCVAASDPASRAWYTRTQMPLFAWSSQASGFVTGRFKPEDREDPALAAVVRTWFNEANFQRLERARDLAAQKGLTLTQVALAYVLNQPFPTFALIGPQTMEETNQSIAALGVSLTPKELRWLNLED